MSPRRDEDTETMDLRKQKKKSLQLWLSVVTAFGCAGALLWTLLANAVDIAKTPGRITTLEESTKKRFEEQDSKLQGLHDLELSNQVATVTTLQAMRDSQERIEKALRIAPSPKAKEETP